MTTDNRLTIELEFVQCLANPAYLTFLVEQGYLKDKKFLAYLAYLDSYLSTAPYAVLLIYPNSLSILRLLLRPEFRKQLTESTAAVVDYLHKQQYHHWLNYNTLADL